MAEPAGTTAALAVTGVTVPVLTLAGVSLGLRADVLIAGLSGALAAIALLNSVPSSSDTMLELVRTTSKRMGVAVASALMAGYLVPLVGLVIPLATDALPVTLGFAFLIGAGAQRFLKSLLDRGAKQIGEARP